jgi:uncharacterized protein YbaP (TraB family)
VLVFLLSPLPSAVAEMPYGQGRLWRIEKPGVAPNYVFGTMHSSDPAVLDLPVAVRDAFTASQHVVLEVAGTSTLDPSVVREFFVADGYILPDLVGIDLYHRIVIVLDSYGVDPNGALNLQPWGVIILLTFSPSEMQRRNSGALSLDRMLEEEAYESGRTVYSLETVEEQLAVFADMSLSDQLTLLRAMFGVTPPPVVRPRESLKEVYLRGDLAGLFNQQASYEDAETQAVVERLMVRMLDERNINMVRRVLPVMDNGSVFMAVGAMHLPGELGVLSLLANEGYEVTPVP